MSTSPASRTTTRRPRAGGARALRHRRFGGRRRARRTRARADRRRDAEFSSPWIPQAPTLVVAAWLPAISAMSPPPPSRYPAASRSSPPLARAAAVAALPPRRRRRRAAARAPMEMQEIEFIIYPDGRVEERDRRQGRELQQLTAKLNEALGEVYHTAPPRDVPSRPSSSSRRRRSARGLAWGQTSWGDGGGGGGGGIERSGDALRRRRPSG